MCDDLEYSTDTRRNDRNQAKANHFKSGKKQIRCHKDVVAKEKSISEENDASKLNFKTRSLLAKETLKIMKDQRDEPSDTIPPNYIFTDDYLENTKYYTEKIDIKIEKPKLIHEDGPDVSFPVKNILSLVWEIEKDDLSKWAIINSPSALEPGGDFGKDASAFEETLMLSSCLYGSLAKCEGKAMYKKHNKMDPEEGLYTNDLIYSPDVPFFRNEDLELIEDWKTNFRTLSIITSPAVNYNIYSKNHSDGDYEKNMKVRINRIFKTALKHGHTKLIIGTWGCGLDGGPLDHVMKWFSQDDLSDYFDEIYFISNDEDIAEIMEENFLDPGDF